MVNHFCFRRSESYIPTFSSKKWLAISGQSFFTQDCRYIGLTLTEAKWLAMDWPDLYTVSIRWKYEYYCHNPNSIQTRNNITYPSFNWVWHNYWFAHPYKPCCATITEFYLYNLKWPICGQSFLNQILVYLGLALRKQKWLSVDWQSSVIHICI